jgi:hypothetical protein
MVIEPTLATVRKQRATERQGAQAQEKWMR